MDHYKGINENERYNNDLLNEIRKTNQLLERLISNKETKTESKPRSEKNGTTSGRKRTGSTSRNTK